MLNHNKIAGLFHEGFIQALQVGIVNVEFGKFCVKDIQVVNGFLLLNDEFLFRDILIAVQKQRLQTTQCNFIFLALIFQGFNFGCCVIGLAAFEFRRILKTGCAAFQDGQELIEAIRLDVSFLLFYSLSSTRMMRRPSLDASGYFDIAAKH